MEIVSEIFMTYILPLIGTGLAAFITWCAKKIEEAIRNKNLLETEKKAALTCVKAVEQMYDDLHGSEKLEKALEGFAEILANKGITISALEMRMFIEEAVQELNAAAQKALTE